MKRCVDDDSARLTSLRDLIGISFLLQNALLFAVFARLGGIGANLASPNAFDSAVLSLHCVLATLPVILWFYFLWTSRCEITTRIASQRSRFFTVCNRMGWNELQMQRHYASHVPGIQTRVEKIGGNKPRVRLTLSRLSLAHWKVLDEPMMYSESYRSCVNACISDAGLPIPLCPVIVEYMSSLIARVLVEPLPLLVDDPGNDSFFGEPMVFLESATCVYQVSLDVEDEINSPPCGDFPLLLPDDAKERFTYFMKRYRAQYQTRYKPQEKEAKELVCVLLEHYRLLHTPQALFLGQKQKSHFAASLLWYLDENLSLEEKRSCSDCQRLCS
jgi:hypothetical protein